MALIKISWDFGVFYLIAPYVLTKQFTDLDSRFRVGA
jgi:hypothetical protein